MDDFEAEVELMNLQALGAEEVVYTPAGGQPRKVWALLDRFSPRQAGGSVGGQAFQAPKIRVTGVNHPTYGIDAGQLNGAGQDKVTVAYPSVTSAPIDLPIHFPSDERQVSSGPLARFELR